MKLVINLGERVMRYLFSVVLVLSLSGCTEQQFVKSVTNIAVSSGEFIGVLDKPNTMQRPSYYSSQPIKRDYRLGQTYQISHLDCNEQNCR